MPETAVVFDTEIQYSEVVAWGRQQGIFSDARPTPTQLRGLIFLYREHIVRDVGADLAGESV